MKPRKSYMTLEGDEGNLIWTLRYLKAIVHYCTGRYSASITSRRRMKSRKSFMILLWKQGNQISFFHEHNEIINSVWIQWNQIWFLYKIWWAIYDPGMVPRKSYLFLVRQRENQKIFVRLRRTPKWSSYDPGSKYGSCTVPTKLYMVVVQVRGH